MERAVLCLFQKTLNSKTRQLTFVPLSLWILLDIPGMGTDFRVLEVLVAGTNGLLVATPEEDICL